MHKFGTGQHEERGVVRNNGGNSGATAANTRHLQQICYFKILYQQKTLSKRPASLTGRNNILKKRELWAAANQTFQDPPGFYPICGAFTIKSVTEMQHY